MKKSKRYVRICAALLCAVLCLSVNVAPAMAAKVTQADIDALKGNAASLDKKQKEQNYQEWENRTNPVTGRPNGIVILEGNMRYQPITVLSLIHI